MALSQNGLTSRTNATICEQLSGGTNSTSANLFFDFSLFDIVECWQFFFFFAKDTTLIRRMKSCVKSCSTHQKSKLRSRSPQTCKTEVVLHLVPRGSTASTHQPQTRLEARVRKQQKLLLQLKTEWTAISSSMLAPPFCAGWEVPAATLPSPAGSRRNEFPPSTDITSHHNQASAAARSVELRIRSVLPSARCVQHCTSLLLFFLRERR